MALVVQVGGPEDFPPPPPRFPTCGDWDYPDHKPEQEEEAGIAENVYDFRTKGDNSAGCVVTLSLKVVALCIVVVNFLRI